MQPKVSKELIFHRLEQAKSDIKASEVLYKENLLNAANNRAYYAIFHAIRSILAIEPVDFKKHKDVIAYFNKNYVNTGIFPKMIGRKISQATQIREDSDYDDKFEPDDDKTKVQMNTAKEVVDLIEKYINEKLEN